MPNWSIFPVTLSQKGDKVEKKPAVAWKDYMTRRPTEEELHTWFDTPQYNAIGLATGKISGVVVVDLDSETIPDGIELDSPLICKTISGGRHFYYQWDEELRNDAKIEGLPIDFRGDGGFVVIPPSSLGDKNYQWTTENEICPEFLLEPLPEDIKELLKGRKQITNMPVKTFSRPIAASFPHKVDYGEGLDEIMPPVASGERNVRAAEYAGKIVVRLTPDLWEDFGWPELQRWNATNQPPLPERELRNTWQSIQNIELRRREAEGVQLAPVIKQEGTVETFKDQQTDLGICTIYRGKEATETYQKLSTQYGDGITTGYEELDFFFKFLPEQLYLISAQTHVGKSTLALNICSRVATLGYKVLFCSLEQGIFIEPRVRSILDGDFPDSLSILASDKMIKVEQLVQIIEQSSVKPDLVCIDHIHFLEKKGRGATEDIEDIILKLQNMAKKLALPIVVISHVRKLNNDKAPDLDDLKDTVSLSQVPGVIILIHRKRNGSHDAYGSILSNEGTIIVAKNRIQGKTGIRTFLLSSSGNIDIQGYQHSLINRKAEDLDEEETRTLFS